MLKSWLDYDERGALQAILRHHGIDPDDGDGQLLADLSTFCNWTRADEQAKAGLTGQHPPLLLVLLGQLGIWGADALTPQ